MADTIKGDFPDAKCSDCGEMGCTFKHWGPLVPKNTVGSFCLFCWRERNDSNKEGKEPKPLGIQPPGIPQEFLNKKLKVKTESGSVYELTPTDNIDELLVLCDSKNTGFTKARVLNLSIGKSLFLKPRDGDNLSLWYTTPIISVE